MYETLLRPQDVNQVPTLTHISEVSDKLKLSELKREEKRLKQIANSRLKRKREENPDEEVSVRANDPGLKRIKTDDEDGTECPAENEGPEGPILRESLQVPMTSLAATSSAPPPISKINVSKTVAEVRGHTSYLTFACLLPTI